jgi:2'-5' RNA ligase
MSIADLAPGQHAERVQNHWWWRPGWRQGRSFYAFHFTFEDQLELHRLARAHRAALADLATVTLVPDRWLHMTMHGLGFTDEIPAAAVSAVVAEARRTLADIPAPEVTFRDVVVADEAIALPAEPADPVRDIRTATREAIGAVLGHDRVSEDPHRYRPHVSVAYIRADGPALPYIHATAAVRANAVRLQLRNVDLIELNRDHRMYEWKTITRVPLG